MNGGFQHFAFRDKKRTRIEKVKMSTRSFLEENVTLGFPNIHSITTLALVRPGRVQIQVQVDT